MSTNKHLFCRKGYFYYRSKIPTDLLHFFPSSELKKSLKTTDREAATTLAASLRLRTQKVFTLLRTGMVSEEQTPVLISELVGKKVSDNRKIPTLSGIIEHYTKETLGNWGPKTSLEMQGTFKLLQDILGDIRVSAIVKQTIVELRDTLACLPSCTSPNANSHSTQQIPQHKNEIHIFPGRQK